MARAEVGTAKYASKKLKASGLQKLKFYCQICEKQCRDANGFKNHLSSPSHLGRIENIGSGGKNVVEQYSQQFKSEFIRLLRINHGTKKINANKFYQEYIFNDRDHVHMNSTKWTSLTTFVKHLGQSGIVKVVNPTEADEFNLEICLVDVSQQEVKEEVASNEDVSNRFLEKQIKKGKEVLEVKEKKIPLLSTGPVKLSMKKVVKDVTQGKSVFDDE